MGGGETCWTQLLLVVSMGFSSLIYPAASSQMEVMSAPSVLRAGTAENIFLEIQDCACEADMRVVLSVMNFPTKTTLLTSKSVTLTKANNYQDFGRITIPLEDFSQDPAIKQYVFLQASFPNRKLEKLVLVSFQFGYIFIQTDKNVYTPESNVFYRIFAVNQALESVGMENDDEMKNVVDVEIVSPDGLIVQHDSYILRSGVFSGSYLLPANFRNNGQWQVVAMFQSDRRHKFAAEFEVKENVPPSFEVKLTPGTSFFRVDSNALTINIQARYVYGKEVDGTGYVVFGLIDRHLKKSFPGSLQRVPIVRGNGQATLKREHITQIFSDIANIVGSSIYATVGVLTDGGDEMVTTDIKGIKIVTSPYCITFKRTPRFFKPGMSFPVMVEVVNPDDTPAPGVAVTVDPGSVTATTTVNGVARVDINTVQNLQSLTITVRSNDPGIPPQRQASASMTAYPHTTKSNTYIHIDVDTYEMEVGGNMRISLIFNRPEGQKDITLLFLSRGQLVKYERHKNYGRSIMSLVTEITKAMLPSFRVIAYYTSSDEVISDSVWINVKDTCTGMLKLEILRPAASHEPHKSLDLKITGDPEAMVGLLAVDKSFHTSNKHRLIQKKIWDIVEKYDTGCTPGGGKDSMNVFYDAGLLFESGGGGTPYRTDFKCSTPSRRKRAITSTSNRTSLEGYSDDFIVRTTLPESWLWTEIQLSACPPNDPNCAFTSLVKKIFLPDSVRSWHFTGISLSRAHGICVADPLDVTVWKNFFIDLTLPYSVVHGEQLEIKAVLHNYLSDRITVLVDLEEDENVCSAAYRRGRYRQEVQVEPYSTRPVPFIFIPMKVGEMTIKVKASVKNMSLTDGVQKQLRVVSRGILVKSQQTVLLDPSRKGLAGNQVETINSNIPSQDLLPNTPTNTIIYLTGRKPLPLQPNEASSGASVGHMIRVAGGSGEQNMHYLSLTVTATLYLDKTNQWDSVGIEKRNEALETIRTGYLHELQFRKDDGSFSMFSSFSSSTWLTAFVAKVFAMANSLVAVDRSHICDAIKFLIFKAQQPDGRFSEVGRVLQKEFTGDVTGTDSDASMTAFCLIALKESQGICSDTVNVMSWSITKAASYLENSLSGLTNPYAVAMTSYALATENKLNKEILFKFAAPDRSHWPSQKGQVYTLEATAYAVLALIKAKEFEKAKPIVEWICLQQRVYGYGDTQATITVYQAVAEYWTNAKETEDDLVVELDLPHMFIPVKYKLNKENYHITRVSKFWGINRDLKVTASGTGKASLKVVSLYHVVPQDLEPQCKFDLNVELIPEKMTENEKIYRLKIQMLFKDRGRDASMSVLDVGLLAGFTFNKNDLDLLSGRRGLTIGKYETNSGLSERGSLIIYLDKISNKTPEEVSIRIHQLISVDVLQPAAVSVYDPFDKEHCVKFYHPQRRNGQLQSISLNDEYVCAEEKCGLQKKGNVHSNERTAKACENTPSNKVDFVYKVRVEVLTDGLSTDRYIMRIDEVLKQGIDTDLQGKLRSFIGVPHCREALGLTTDKTYLIMGSSRNIHRDESQFQYVLSEEMWIEYWPTRLECISDTYRATCMGLEDLRDVVEIYGCPN
ncbi:complement C3-like [Melanotaenia boesemani]|uniref:complement C3-like n=1 Tax=Melanotaenia boesemani TaxID=1250792 RepID=UPI001C049E2E|nr:complement C3-like [Melanotaenia boesemani]